MNCGVPFDENKFRPYIDKNKMSATYFRTIWAFGLKDRKVSGHYYNEMDCVRIP